MIAAHLLTARPHGRAILRAVPIAFALLASSACHDTGTDLRAEPVRHAYAADRVYNCPVPFVHEAAGTFHVWEGADLVLRQGGGVELTFYSRHGSGEDAINWQADTLRVQGSYVRDGFALRFVFDEGYTGRVPMEAELAPEGRLLAAFPDGSQMEFVPMDQKPTGPAEPCQA